MGHRHRRGLLRAVRIVSILVLSTLSGSSAGGGALALLAAPTFGRTTSRTNFSRTWTVLPVLPASKDCGAVPATTRPEETSSLQFVGRTVFTSDPVPLPPGGSTALADYFRAPEHRNHLLLGEGAQQSSTIGKGGESVFLPAVETLPPPIPPELWDRWSKEATRAGTIPPCPLEDKLLLVKSSGIPFPLGMTIFVKSIVGAKLLTENSLPEYQFTLVKDTVRAEGPRALVWVHDKLTGAGEEKREQTTHSFSTLRAYPSENNKVTFISDSRIEINVRFPAVLLRLLPMSRERCNEMGSASIQKSFEERGAPSLRNFVQSYIKWLGETRRL